jgi:hypothetical protein
MQNLQNRLQSRLIVLPNLPFKIANRSKEKRKRMAVGCFDESQPPAPEDAVDVELVLEEDGEAANDAELVGNTFRAIICPLFSPSYISPPYPGHISNPGIIGLK